MAWIAFAWLAGCAPDPGELTVDCDPRVLEPGEVRAKRIACEEELIPGGEGRVDDWLIENAVARFVVRDTYASLTQLGEEGGTLIDAVEVGGDDLLMELMLEGVRSPVSVGAYGDDAFVRTGDFRWRLSPDDPMLRLDDQPAEPNAVWVPKPGVDRCGTVTRSSRDFLAVVLAGRSPVSAGQLLAEGLLGVQPDAAEWGPETTPVAGPIDADAVDVFQADGVRIDRIPVIDGELASGGGGDTVTLAGYRPGCVYDGLTKLGCGGLSVRVRDDHGADLAATVHFAGDDFPLAVGGGRAPLGVDAGEAWVWAGPRYGAWHGWFSGGEDRVEVVLPLAMPAEMEWPDGAGPGALATWASGGSILADFAVEVAPDADHALYAEDAIHALRAEGVGWATLIADDEVPVVTQDIHDDVIVTVGTRSSDVWDWGVSSTTRRSGHGAPDWLGFGALDRLTLVRGGAGADRFTIVSPEWVSAAFAEAPQAWTWPVSPSALWLSSAADFPALDALAAAWIDVQPVAARTWLPYTGALNYASATRALYSRLASAGNGPRIDVAWVEPPGLDLPFHTLSVSAWAPAWMGAMVVTAHTDRGNFAVSLDASGHANVRLRDQTWVYLTVEVPRSLPWGGDAAWAVSALRWVGMPELRPPTAR